MKKPLTHILFGSIDCGVVHLTEKEKHAIDSNVCYSCGYKGAIKWNPFNKVVQCHNCGQTIAKPEPEIDDKEKVQFT